MKLDLHAFIEATRSMHTHSGVKRTRLMLHLRPYDRRNTFLLKSTDGRHTFTTRVRHQGQIKLVENLVNGFVQHCTSATLDPAGHVSSAGAASNAAAAAATAAAPATHGKGAHVGTGGRVAEGSSAKTQETVALTTAGSNLLQGSASGSQAKKGSSGGGKQRGGNKKGGGGGGNANNHNNKQRNR